MKKFSLWIFAGLICIAPFAHAATITVPATHATLQAAIDAANAGDVIQITDSATYNEDVFIGPGKNNLTIIGTGATPPTILAANTTLSSGGAPNVAGRGLVGVVIGLASALLAGNNPIPDQLGMIVEADFTTLENLIIQNNGPSVSPDLFTGALTIVGDDTTINNCILRGADQSTPGVADNEFAISWTAGNWPELDAILPGLGLGAYFANAGYPNIVASQRTTLNNCAIERSTNSVGAGDYSQFFYNAITSGYLNAQVPFNIVFNDCTFVGGVGDGEVLETGGVDNVVMNNCVFDGNGGIVDIGGGFWIFNDCSFSGSTGSRYFRHDGIVEFGGGAADTQMNGCIFCGDSPSNGEFIEIQEGAIAFDRCIFSGAEDTAVRWNYNNWDGQFNTVGYPTDAQVLSFNRCDIYKPDGTAAAVLLTGGDTPDAGQPGAELVLTNNIITSELGVRTEGANLPPGGTGITIENNNFIGTTVLENTNGWVEDSIANNLSNIFPGYANAGGCNAEDYAYSNTALITAGIGGTPLGSQDPPGLAPASVEDWKLYE